jgi:hypothetical protein
MILELLTEFSEESLTLCISEINIMLVVVCQDFEEFAFELKFALSRWILLLFFELEFGWRPIWFYGLRPRRSRRRRMLVREHLMRMCCGWGDR